MRIAFRTDASPQIGTGHLARCLSLASALRERGAECTFICRDVPAAHAAQMEMEGIRLLRTPAAAGDARHGWLGVSSTQDAEETASLLDGEHFDWLVVDSYALDASWERKLRRSANRVLAIDDLADRPHECDVLLDQNLYHDMERRYDGRIPSSARLLAGPKYALLRKDFAVARRSASIRNGTVRRILVFFGGIDAAGHTNSAIEALASSQLDAVEVDVVVGELHPRLDDIRRQCRAHGYTLHVQTRQMAELMLNADLAVGAGGSATWERCCVGLPAIVFTVAENQRQLVEDAAFAGIVYAPDVQATDSAAIALHVRAVMSNPRLLAAISKRGMETVDGNGAQRVMHAMNVSAVTIRRAASADIQSMFDWRNDPEIRTHSRNKAQIELQAHRAWAEAVLSDPGKMLLIGEHAGQPVGVVRFDVGATQAEVSIYMVPGSGGQGLGSDLLNAAERWLLRDAAQVTHVSAEVLDDNEPSHRLFRRAGYAREATRYLKRLNR